MGQQPPPLRQMSMTQVQPRGASPPSESRPFPQQDRVGGREDELIAALAKQLAGRVGGTKMGLRPMEDPAPIVNSRYHESQRGGKTKDFRPTDGWEREVATGFVSQ